MKVIIIKDCKDGKENQVVEVKDGYGKNFLIKNKWAIPYNQVNLKKLQVQQEKQDAFNAKQKAKAIKIKDQLESLNIVFEVNTTNSVVHGFITRKQIHKQLEKLGFNVDNRIIENVKINTLGNSFVSIKLFKNVEAKLKIEVVSEK